MRLRLLVYGIEIWRSAVHHICTRHDIAEYYSLLALSIVHFAHFRAAVSSLIVELTAVGYCTVCVPTTPGSRVRAVPSDRRQPVSALCNCGG